jgi:hypothetical protein
MTINANSSRRISPLPAQTRALDPPVRDCDHTRRAPVGSMITHIRERKICPKRTVLGPVLSAQMQTYNRRASWRASAP